MKNENEIIEIVEERVRKELEEKIDINMLGYIHMFEKRKKEILRDEYGIEFKTSREKSSCETID